MVLLVGAVLIASAGLAQAQEPTERATTIFEYLQQTEQWEQLSPEAQMQMHQSLEAPSVPATPQTSVAGFEVRDAEATFGADPWPRGDLNFIPRQLPVAAGDVTGNGVNDYLYHYSNVADDRTGELSDRTDKTLLVFGGTDDFSDRYYDELYYGNLQPAGNLTGESDNAHAVEVAGGELRIYAGSDIGYVDLGVVQGSLSGSTLLPPVDLDGNGYDDLIFTSGFGFNLTVVFGGETIDDIEFRTFNLGIPTVGTLATFNVDELGGASSLVRLTGDQRDDGLVITRYSIDANRDAIIEEEFAVERSDGSFPEGRGNPSDITFADIDGSGIPEMLVQVSNVFGGFTSEETLVYSADVGSEGDGLSYNTPPLEYPTTISAAGDLNGNGRTDFLFLDDDELYVSFAPEVLEDGLSPDVAVASNVGTEALPPFASTPLGDVTGDGLDNVVTFVAEEATFGPRLIGSTGSSVETDDFTFSVDEFTRSIIWQPVSLGDWNADGSDDIAFLVHRGTPSGDAQGQVDLYLGDTDPDGVPDLTLAHPDNAAPGMAVTGDFTGNGQPNLAVSWRSEGTVVSIYEAGQGHSPVHTINFDDLAPDIEAGAGISVIDFAIANVGDVNGSEVDDLLVGAAPTNKANTAFLFLGGVDIADTPDVNVNLEGLTDFPGSSIQPLGDINQNGTDDFAVGISGNRSGDTGIIVFFGQDLDGGTPTFDSPDVNITLDNAEGENIFLLGLGMAVGDFNGNGIPDLAAKSFRFQASNDFEGIEGIRIYHGGPDFDGTLDEKLFIPGPPLDYVGNQSGPQYLLQSTGELTALPDITGDGSNDLLLGTTTQFDTNALIYSGNGSEAPEPSIVLRAPNQTWGLGTNNNNIHSNNRVSAVGDFNGDGSRSIILPQVEDPNFRGSPAYAFALTDAVPSDPEDPVVEVKEPVNADALPSEPLTFGETGTSILFSAGTQGEGDVNVLRFASIPSGSGAINKRNVSEYRIEITATGSLTIGPGTEVRFDVDRLSGISNPENVTIFTREIPGLGQFSELDTSFDADRNELVAEVDGFSEFAFGSDTEPLFLYPDRVAAELTRTFGEAATPGDYRLVALPGMASLSLEEAVAGRAGVQWQAYLDDGSDEDFLVRFDEEPEAFIFDAGTGFWLTSTDDWTVSDEFDAPALASDHTTLVPLNEGWSIVSNPFDRDVAWRSVRQINEVSQPLWRFDESDGFVQADTMASARSGEAYYVLNDAEQNELIVPYPSTGGAADGFLETIDETPTLALSATPIEHDAPASTIQLGVSERESSALIAPPGNFEAVSLRIQVPTDSSDARTGQALESVRVMEEAGVIFDVTLTPRVDGPVELSASALDALHGYEAVLIDRQGGTSYTVSKPVILDPDGKSMELQVAIGDAEFIDSAAERPDELAFGAVYPNPSDGQVTIEVAVPETMALQVELYNVLGRQVGLLHSGELAPGVHKLRWDGRTTSGAAAASGVYLLRLMGPDGQQDTARLTRVR